MNPCVSCGRSPIAPSDVATDMRTWILLASLETAVLIETANLARQAWDFVSTCASDAASIIGAHGDDLQFGGKHCVKAFTALARGLAALSFCPGGVTFHGRHWCARHPDSRSTEGQYVHA